MRMWIFILLCLLGLNISQTTGQDHSTQMHYLLLTAEKSAKDNITKVLESFKSSQSLTVEDLKISTVCSNTTDTLSCSCEPGFKWSDQVCKSQPKCCEKPKCDVPPHSNPECVSKDTVIITGNVTLEGDTFLDCLKTQMPEESQSCNEKLIKEMKEEYSTLKGLDILTTIGSYRFGVTVDIKMTIAYSFHQSDLTKKTASLARQLKAKFILNTTGVVHLSVPKYPVPYKNLSPLNCSVKEDLHVKPLWQLKNRAGMKKITNGSEATITQNGLVTKLSLLAVSDLWAGDYVCMYRQTGPGYTIDHKASASLDVCIKPKIEISTNPSFSRCQNESNLLEMDVLCEPEKSKENYSVKWTGNFNSHGSSSEVGVYKNHIIVSCNPKEEQGPIICSFTNRCNQTSNASVNIGIIYANDEFCQAEGDWQITRVNATATLKCKNQAGQRQRKCKYVDRKGVWEDEVSDCVNHEVKDLQFQADTVDIGIGSEDENTASVFSRLQNVTNKTSIINTVSNLNASVNVLSTMTQKKPPNEVNVVEDFLGSSSNLLDDSLEGEWNKTIGESNTTLAERYLRSVEDLIHMTNITRPFEKKNVQVAARNCSQVSNCVNEVFNNIVRLEGERPGSVKTAGFKSLGMYLPNNKPYDPNSIVVSTTTENNISEKVKVTIEFVLQKPRPRNHKMICASWDNKTKTWSEYKCAWISDEGSTAICVCEHLSSFAILMAKTPLKLHGAEEITYLGLSISLVSLIISLVIELIIWKAVVKTNTLHLRHTAHINICLCLLVADSCFLASSAPASIPPIWCQTLTVVKHFCYLSMFFWMLSLSSILLHKAVFMFHNVSKKNYLRFSFLLGYICPLLIVTITFLSNKAGAESKYYSKETCWLVYTAPFEGTIHTFIIPVGIIVFFNVFSMLVVILKLLDSPNKAETKREKEKKAFITIMRSVVLLTPIFGVTWLLGFAVMLLDLNSGWMVYAVNYTFILMNAFQGFYILLTTCLGDPMIREELLRCLKPKATASISESSSGKSVTN